MVLKRNTVLAATAALTLMSGCSILRPGARSGDKTPERHAETAARPQPASPNTAASDEPEPVVGQPRPDTPYYEYEDAAVCDLSPVYDSLITVWHEQNAINSYENFFRDFIDIDSTAELTGTVPDSVYEARLKMILSPIEMAFNDVVKRHIVTYTTARKSTISNVLGRSQYYFPIFERELDRQGLPLELRMLPVVESALIPTARSRVGATGLWQFMYGTGRSYGLEITSFVDQRCDPVVSTRAACRYLKDLYNMFGDWTLAIAAYNCGPGNVNKALKRAGGDAKSFWDVYPYLPKETRGYLPSFIAATYVYTFHKQHGIELTPPPVPIATDTLMIDRLTHFDQITSTIGTPVEVIRSLNPQYRLDIVPAVKKSYSLTLPYSDIAKYLDSETEIQAKDTVYLAQYLKPSNLDAHKMEFTIESFSYRVRTGDTLSSIAKKHNVSVSQLIKWNGIKNPNRLKVGQRLEIYR